MTAQVATPAGAARSAGRVLGWNERFAQGCNKVARATGHPVTLALAVGSVLAWAALGPMFGYSELWQLAINTGTTIVTFLMVFLIQNTQNRDSQATQLKLDELIRALEGAHLALLDLEELEEDELDFFREKYRRLATQARQELKQGMRDTGTTDIDQD